MNTRHSTRTALLREIDSASNWRHVPGLWDVFENEDDLLRAAQQQWFNVLGSSIDVALETGDGDLADDVRNAYAAAARRHPGVRRLLDENQHHPAVEASIRREHALVARAAGVTHSSEVIERARQLVVVPRQRQGLLSRVFAKA